LALSTAYWFWPSSNDVITSVSGSAAASLRTLPAIPALAIATKSNPAVREPVDSAVSALPFKVVGTVNAANDADSFALVRLMSDSQLLKLRAGDRIENLTVRAIQSHSVVLGDAARAIVIEVDKAATVPALQRSSRVVSRAPVADVEPAWAGDPAPFGH
jgi:hypothetical protein